MAARRLPIANQIRRLRFEHGEMTQSELAMKIGMTRQTIVFISAPKFPAVDVILWPSAPARFSAK